jgi:D-alanine--poly(phosphoribitol) ligase subunit 1
MTDNNSHNTNKDLNSPLVKGFLASVLSYPHNNALWINERYYTYEELWKIVHTVYLQIPGKTIERIGIYCNDDVYTYASILAVSMYGAAYVPLNNKFPAAKNQTVTSQCDLKLILSSVENEDIKTIAGTIKIISSAPSQLPDSPTPLPVLNNKPFSSTAYILFTSGSTGEPKGVPVSNANVNYFFDEIFKNYTFTEKDKFLQSSELTFDFSVFAFFMPLYVGACCYVVPDSDIKFVKIIQLLQQHKITVLSMVPTILKYVEKYLKEIKLPELKYSFFSGDALFHDLAVKWNKTAPNGTIYNCYGTTETTVICTQYVFDENRSVNESVNGIVPLGKPFERMDVLIVDQLNQPAEKGELCFSGPQVITNYLNGTKEDKFFTYKGKHYYKPGDIGSYNKNGDLIFHGRLDNQVKINGYRVELGEIEMAIEKITNSKCIVLCLKNEKQINTLVAFIETALIDEQKLIKTIASLLPDYMLPQQFLAIEKFPLNANQKTDTNLLLNYIK